MNEDVKWAGIVAAVAFVLSFLIGLISGATFIFLLFRAVLLAGLFFGLTFGGFYLVREFLPELVGESSSEIEGASESAEESDTGTRINISVGDDDTAADNQFMEGLPAERVFAGPVSGEETAQLVEPFPSDGAEDIKTLDQSGEEGYTESGDSVVRSRPVQENPSPGKAAAVPASLIGDVDVLPDLEGFSDSFTAPLVEEAVAEENSGGRSTGSSSSSYKGKGGADFDTKEMASAIQTILKRDQKG